MFIIIIFMHRRINLLRRVMIVGGGWDSTEVSSVHSCPSDKFSTCIRCRDVGMQRFWHLNEVKPRHALNLNGLKFKKRVLNYFLG